MAKRGDTVILDTNVIMECFRLKSWNALAEEHLGAGTIRIDHQAAGGMGSWLIDFSEIRNDREAERSWLGEPDRRVAPTALSGCLTALSGCLTAMSWY
jgi:hypothetical protein